MIKTEIRKDKTKKFTRKSKGSDTCYFTQNKSKPDYKEVLVLKRFLNDRGKIIRQSFSGITAKNQRLLTKSIKRARYMSLLPYSDKHAL